jgi:hypothetical protein
LARTRAGIARLIEAYREQLISLDELRTRMPSLRHREAAIQTQLAALEAAAGRTWRSPRASKAFSPSSTVPRGARSPTRATAGGQRV